MKKAIVLLAISLVFLSGCNSLPSRLGIKDFHNNYQAGDIARKHIVIGEKKIPLGDGDWAVLATGSHIGEISFIGGQVGIAPVESNMAIILLAKIEGNTAKHLAYIEARTSPISFGSWIELPGFCSSGYEAYAVLHESTEQNKRCSYISSISINPQSENYEKVIDDGLTLLKKFTEVAIPETYISDNHFVTNHNDFIFVHYATEADFSEQNPGWNESAITTDQKGYLDKQFVTSKSRSEQLKEALERLEDPAHNVEKKGFLKKLTPNKNKTSIASIY
ncbi:hypothetical protein [Neptunomonas sp. XY-337]|uniref:hypothetical protein n=1 Tax=Neptunomonas sp. XY-337 TaxID=2561897 RepID=UPI0010A9FB4E|nr:hypothetical protein [Neptunomonas sp. XY-337]